MSYTPLSLGDILDTGNTIVLTSENTPISGWTGQWFQTRDQGIVRQLTTITSNVLSGLGGTFTYTYSEDGDGGMDTDISQQVIIQNFVTLLNFDTPNVAAYYMVSFVPSRILQDGENISIKTTQRKQNSGEYFHFPDDVVDELSEPMLQRFAYMKGFNMSGHSANIRATMQEELTVSDTASHNALASIFNVLENPAIQPISGSVSVLNFPSIQSVNVMNLPTTQAVSGAVSVNGSVSVSNLPATQAVSGNTSISNFPSIQMISASTLPLPVGAATSALQISGNTLLNTISNLLLFPSLQPISGSVSVSNLPATQAVSGTVVVNGSVSVSNLPAVQTISGDTTITNIVSISASTLPLPAGAATAGNQASMINALTGPLSVTPPIITKGVQGTSGFTVQDIKDAGRNVTNYFMSTPILTTATDTLMSLTGYKSNAATSATTTPSVVTTGKTYRITSVILTYVSTANPATAKFSLRANTSGLVAITSPVIDIFIIGGTAAGSGVSQTVTVLFPDGLELPSGTGLGVSMIGLGSTQTAAATGYGAISIIGYEY